MSSYVMLPAEERMQICSLCVAIHELSNPMLSMKRSVAWQHKIDGMASGMMHVLKIHAVPAGVVLKRYRFDKEDV
jgi:hypothetical protein